MKQLPPLTVALIALCVVVGVLSNFGESREVLRSLFIASPGQGLSEIFDGQVWRLVSPIFIHFNAIHLLFNMMWLWDLGRLIETTRGPLFLVGFVLVVGIAANLAQYFLGDSVNFGGMSGVVYGLLAYIWMQGRYNPHFGFGLHKATVVMMLIWFVLCWVGVMGNIANWAHTAGLVIGAAWGFLDRSTPRARVVA